MLFTANVYAPDGRRFTVLADDRLTAFLELRAALLGALFVALGFVGAARDIFKDSSSAQKGFVEEPAKWTDLVKALTKLIATILTVPRWLMLTAVGVLLIYGGDCLRLGHLIRFWGS